MHRKYFSPCRKIIYIMYKNYFYHVEILFFIKLKNLFVLWENVKKKFFIIYVKSFSSWKQKLFPQCRQFFFMMQNVSFIFYYSGWLLVLQLLRHPHKLQITNDTFPKQNQIWKISFIKLFKKIFWTS